MKHECINEPDPLNDPLGWSLYQEVFSCTACNGLGEDYEDGDYWVCPRCEGSGVEPDFYVFSHPDE